MKFAINSQEFKWLSEGVPTQKRGKKIRHTSFSIGSLKINVGDFVLVRNDQEDDPEDVLNCFVAQVKDLFYNEDEPDPNQAQVQWFLRASELPNSARKNMKGLENEWEVIQNKSNLWASGSSEVDAETVFQKCEILFLPVDADWESSLSMYDDYPFPVFFCRYSFTGQKVLPVVKENAVSTPFGSESSSSTPKKQKNYATEIEKQNGISSSKKSKSARKTKDKYVASAVADPFSAKVFIKKIDDRVFETLKSNARAFVADSVTDAIGDIAEKFKKNLKIQNNQGKSTSSPIIHSFPSPCSSPKKLSEAKINGYHDENDRLSKKSNTPKRKKETPKKNECILSVKNHSKVKSSPRKSALSSESIKCPSPKKRAKTDRDFDLDFTATTRSGRKVKAVNYREDGLNVISAPATPSKKKIPRYVCDTDSNDSDSCHYSSGEESSSGASISDSSFQDEICKPRSKNSKSSAQTKTPRRLSKRVDLSIPDRKTPLKTPQNVLEETRQRLHVSAVPSSLPCREEEYSDIYSFVRGCLCAHTGGCMYVSGVPGTGKTATVHEVIRNLEEEKENGDVPLFKFIEVNGMWMTDPYQCYVHIYKALTGKSVSSQQAANLLEKRFTERGPKKEAVILIVDELDRLWTRKQTVMYNIFDWPTKNHSKLVVLAIANTMDLPERMMMNRISSRIGLTRKTFQPYTFKQLQEIIMSRIQELKVFDPDAVQLVARKVAAVSGDARRALDICRFATEVINQRQSPRKKQKVLIGMEQIDAALQQMFSSPLIAAIRSCSKISKLFFQCLLSEFTRSGLEETTLLKVYKQVVACCRFEGMHPPNSSEIFNVCANLAASHLLLVDNFQNDLYLKIRLNVSSDDVTYALSLH